jgi:SAM-dependent methyltransferase
MYQSFIELVSPLPTDKVLDVGVTPDRTLIDSNFFEALYPYKSLITATSIEDAGFLEEVYPGLRFVKTDRGSLPFADKSFDIVVSFAVLEHVGTTEEQEHFVRELMRVGRRTFLTTPDRAFPIEVHTFIPFIHWLPRPWHQRILRLLNMDFWSKTENLNLLDEKTLLGFFRGAARVSLYKHKTFGFSSNLMILADDRS